MKKGKWMLLSFLLTFCIFPADPVCASAGDASTPAGGQVTKNERVVIDYTNA